ncbi:TetR/AcrR family transcriptional regulator [Paenibacillus guangzhouensis]|uniref:TetR/AcrR family transcriptional regulator n=1 Tax=Paenibacillus guangzhouensis TaxID=1473112 RepID=UPI00187B37E5|nr:TetR/AcrR family transcriptional regulator [Paenibacillus guangzhouensis]
MKLREKQLQLTREMIKEAALATFCEKGIEGADLVLIAARSGTSRRTLYHHFKDKEQLATEVYVDNLRRMFGRLLLDFDFKAPRSSLEAILNKYLSMREHHPDLLYYDSLFNVYFASVGKNPAELPEYKQLLIDEARLSTSAFTLEPESEETGQKLVWIERTRMVTHLYFTYLQKSVLNSRQNREVSKSAELEQDERYKQFLLSLWSGQ